MSWSHRCLWSTSPFSAKWNLHVSCRLSNVYSLYIFRSESCISHSMDAYLLTLKSVVTCTKHIALGQLQQLNPHLMTRQALRSANHKMRHPSLHCFLPQWTRLFQCWRCLQRRQCHSPRDCSETVSQCNGM